MKKFLSIFLFIGEEALGRLELKRTKLLTSGSILVAVNIIPIIGVLFLGWDHRMVILLFWAESAVIGLFNVCKLLITGLSNGIAAIILGLFLAVFFTVHYGIFMFVHGMFLFMILFGGAFTGGGGADTDPSRFLSLLMEDFSPESFSGLIDSELLGLIALVISHAVSFYIYFLREKEYLGDGGGSSMGKLMRLMFAPYGRIIVMHLVIIFGAILVLALKGDNRFFFLLLIVLKIFMDLRGHLKEKLSSKSVLPFLNIKGG